MKRYLCGYLDQYGDVTHIQRDFSSYHVAKREISQLAQRILFVKPVVATGFSRVLLLFSSSPSMDDLIGFTYFLSNSLKIGYSLVDALSLTLEQLSNRRLYFCIGHVLCLLNEGKRFSDALSEQAHVFPFYYSAVVKTGEASGSLTKVLDSLLEYMEKQQQFYQHFRQLLFYPVVVLCLLLGLVFIVVNFVVPKFQLFLGGIDNFPLPSRILFASSDFFSLYSGQFFLALFLLMVLFYLVSRIRKVAFFLSFAVLNVIKVKAAAPSLILLAFAAVIVPAFSKAGFKVENLSILTLAGSSSVSIIKVFAFFIKISTDTISSLNKPF